MARDVVQIRLVGSQKAVLLGDEAQQHGQLDVRKPVDQVREVSSVQCIHVSSRSRNGARGGGETARSVTHGLVMHAARRHRAGGPARPRLFAAAPPSAVIACLRPEPAPACPALLVSPLPSHRFLLSCPALPLSRTCPLLPTWLLAPRRCPNSSSFPCCLLWRPCRATSTATRSAVRRSSWSSFRNRLVETSVSFWFCRSPRADAAEEMRVRKTPLAGCRTVLVLRERVTRQ